MAHIVVYLQRTPRGLHPASAIALCWARDIASERGASVTAVAAGDAGSFDRGLVKAAGRFGADTVLFGGPEALANLQGRLLPVHVLLPWTMEGQAMAQRLAYDEPVPRWIERPHPPFGGPDAVTGVIAGTLPWHNLSTELDAEYEDSVEQVDLPAWLMPSGEDGPTFRATETGPRRYIAEGPLDVEVLKRLRAAGATAAEPVDVTDVSGGTFFWFDARSSTLPAACVERSPESRLFLFPGRRSELDPTWSSADWVFGGPWPDAFARLEGVLGEARGE